MTITLIRYYLREWNIVTGLGHYLTDPSIICPCPVWCSVCVRCGAIFTDTDGHPWIPCAPVSCQTKPEQPFSLDTTCSDQEPRQTGSQPWFLVTSPDQPPALIKLLTVKIPDSCDHDSPHHNLFTNSNLLSENINQCKSLSYSVFLGLFIIIDPWR